MALLLLLELGCSCGQSEVKVPFFVCSTVRKNCIMDIRFNPHSWSRSTEVLCTDGPQEADKFMELQYFCVSVVNLFGWILYVLSQATPCNLLIFRSD